MLVSFGVATPAVLLLTIFLLSAGFSLTTPARLSISPLLVTRAELERHRCQWGRLQHQSRRRACSRGLNHHRIWNCRTLLARRLRQSRTHRCTAVVALASLPHSPPVRLILLGLAREPIVALCASLVTGAPWTLVVASLYAAAQIALPDRVRARGLEIFLTVFFGAITVGSAAWGMSLAWKGFR
jgi:hypothetical protein